MRLRIFVGLFNLVVVVVILDAAESPGLRIHGERSYGSDSPGRRIEENFNPQIQGSKYFNSEFEEDLEDDKVTQTPRRSVIDSEVADQLEGNGWLDVIPGNPGKDYPNYEKIPRTSFTCRDKTAGGYYADVEARCQVFHVCNNEGQKISFLCPSGSIFNQKYFVCDWWYDFECDDATDLYSLNEKVNRGGTGSGPSGPGRIEDNREYSSNAGNFAEQESPIDQQNGNYVSADGFDLSLAGTGEGGAGYSRNGNRNKGYQDYEEKRNRKNNFDGKKKEEPNESSGENKNRDSQSKVSSSNEGVESGGEHFRKQNSAVNYRVNYQSGYANADSNSAVKSDNLGNGREYRNDYVAAERVNGFNNERRDNQGSQNTGSNKNSSQRNNNRQNFGERSAISSSSVSDQSRELHSNTEEVENEKKYRKLNNQEPNSSEFRNNEEYENPFVNREAVRRSNTRGRQRTSGGLPKGLENVYQSPEGGVVRELPGSEGIAGSVSPSAHAKVYEGGNQRLGNSQQKILPSSGSRNPGEITDLRSDNDSQRVGLNYQNKQIRRSDFKEDNSTPLISNDENHNRSLDNKRSPNNQENYNQRSINNYGNDYLVGVVNENQNRGNKTSASDQSRRFLPIL